MSVHLDNSVVELARIERHSGSIEMSAAGGTPDAGVADAVAAEPAWLRPPKHRIVKWEVIGVFETPLEGHIVAGSLSADGVPAFAMTFGPSIDLSAPSVVWVPCELVRRAQWLMAWPAVSEAELVYLATGEGSVLGGESGSL